MSSPTFPSCPAPDRGRRVSDEGLELIARRFAMLSEPLRLRLVHLLFDGEKNVHTLVAESGGSQGNVSRHLHALAEAGVLSRRKDGLQVFYALADPTVYQLCDLACGSLEQQLARQASALHRPEP